MRQRFVAVLLAIALSFSISRAALAQDNKLKVGDAAPEWCGGKWIKGEPVKSWEPGKIYVVEFWASWCGPCRDPLAKLTELQTKYAKDNIVCVAQDAWEQGDDQIEPFVEEMGDKMNVHVATDSKASDEGAMGLAWLTASQQTTLPCIFIIDKAGKISWIGKASGLESALKKIVAGTFDAQKEAADQAARTKMQQMIAQADHGGSADAALNAIDDYEKLHPEIAKSMAGTRFALLLQKKDQPGAVKAGEAALDAEHDHPDALNAMAWSVVESDEPSADLLVLGMKIADRANELTKGKDYQILDTLAHLNFLKGNIDQAIDIEDKAIHLAPDTIQMDLQNTLQEFMDAKKKK